MQHDRRQRQQGGEHARQPIYPRPSRRHSSTSTPLTSSRRRHPPDKQVLSDISLSFLPGAKIGVLGYNGAGKSTLLRIMAGLDTEFDGEAQLAPGATVGLLEQEPDLDPAKTVKENVEDGDGRDPRAARSLHRAVDELLRGDRRRDGPRPGADRRRRRLEPRHDARDRDGRAALPAARRRRHARSPAASAAGSRCAGCCSASPTCCCSTSRPTTSTPSRSPGSSATSTTTRARSSPSPTTGTSSTTSPGWILELDRGRGIPYQGNYSGWLEQKRARLQDEARQESSRQRTIERELEWVRMNASARRASRRRA